MSNRAYSASESDASESSENAYCIFLHIVEGIGLNPREGVGDYCDRHKDKIILNASLNGVKFEVEGHSTETTTIFNSNCIWECELGDIKRMKTDNRPVKLECFSKTGRTENSPRRTIGSLLLPIRGVLTLTALRDTQFKLHWHKLGTLSAEWRQSKPEIYLLLIIVKKTLIENGQLEALLSKKKCPPVDVFSPHISETALMLQSQSNVYVQLLEQMGVIQVGNNPDVDCDIFHVSLTFKQLKNVERLLELERGHSRPTDVLIFHYDFLSSVSQLDILVNVTDCYTVNEKISLSFKSSLRSLRLYFQRIFYIPINLYFNNIAIANYRFDVSKLLPDDLYFNTHKVYTKNGSFYFDRLHKILSPRSAKPSVDFIFSVQLVNSYSKRNNFEMLPLNETFLHYKVDEKAAGDMHDCYRNLDLAPIVHLHKRLAYENGSSHSANSVMNEKHYLKPNTETLLISNGHTLEEKVDLYLKSAEKFNKETSTARESHLNMPKQTSNQCVGTSDREEPDKPCQPKALHKNVGTDNKENDINMLNTTTIAVNTDASVEATTCAVDNVSNTASAPVPTPAAAADNQIQQKLPEKDSVGQTATKAQSPVVNDSEELTFKIVQELEEWKAQQMEYFLCELERKEAVYMADLDKQWEQQRATLQARLDAKIAQCEELNAKLEKAHAELNTNAQQKTQSVNIVDTVKREIECSYAQKFHVLDMQMQRLKVEMQQKGTVFEIQHKEVQIENTRLEREKAELKDRIEQLEQQLTAMQKTQLSSEQLKQVLADVRIQNERYTDLEKSKNYYKEQWTKTTLEVHKLKLSMLKQQQKCLQEKNTKDFDICLEEILNEEQDALNSDRSELKSIKEMLFISTDTSACELDE